ncbi:MAG: Gfo/Idh/MocA family oxidoreductase [Rhizobiaceae bacterium]|nr:Gfo/Idh/MocA family oxidoreductase [Rhizobiaceae bacterium]
MNSATSGPVRLGMIGCGAISTIHGEAMQASREVVFAACADKSAEAARAFADRFGATGVHGDMIAMVRAEKLDGVVLATWPAHHHQHVFALIDAGVRFILCEKSLTTSGPLAMEIHEKARQAGATVIEGFMFRHHPLYQQLDALVQGGEIGKVDTIRAGFQELDEDEVAPAGGGGKWRQQKASGGGVAYDGTCYPLHACNHLARSLPAKVSFDGEMSRFGTLVRLHGWVRYENGITALIHSSLRAVVCKETEVNGATGSLYLPIAYGFNIPERDAIRKRTGINNLSMTDVTLPPPRQPGGHENRLAPRRQLESFAEMIRGTSPSRVPLIESVANAFTMDAIIKSAETGRVVDVEMPSAVRDAWHGRALAA